MKRKFLISVILVVFSVSLTFFCYYRYLCHSCNRIQGEFLNATGLTVSGQVIGHGGNLVHVERAVEDPKKMRRIAEAIFTTRNFGVVFLSNKNHGVYSTPLNLLIEVHSNATVTARVQILAATEVIVNEKLRWEVSEKKDIYTEICSIAESN